MIRQKFSEYKLNSGAGFPPLFLCAVMFLPCTCRYNQKGLGGTMNQEPITSLKGIGEKTGALFKRLGIETVEELLHYYPRAYDAYEPAIPVGQVQEGKI